MSSSPVIALLDMDGVVVELLTPNEHGPVAREWWSLLDKNEICRYCLHRYTECSCTEADR